MPLTQAARESDFLGSIAVDTHFQQGWQYGDVPSSVASYGYIGATTARDAFNPDSLAAAAAAGVKFDMLIYSGWDIPTVVAEMEKFQAAHPGSIVAIEGPNEVNNFPVSYKGMTGTPAAQAYQHDLFAAVKGSATLKTIPVYGFTTWPNATNDSDFANFHSYPDHGDYATWRLNTDLKDEQAVNPGKPLVATEAGYHTLTGPYSREGVDEVTQAKMITSMFLDAFKLGVSKTYAYQLLDQYTDQSNTESHYGLFRLDFTPKPAAIALHNLTTILDDHTGSAAVPGRLDMALSGMPSTGKSLLLQQADGDFDLAVWNEPDVWNETTDTRIGVAAQTVSLDLGTAHALVQVFDPLQGTTPIASVANTAHVSFALSDHPVILRISAAGTTGGTTGGGTTAPTGQTLTGTAGAETLTGGALGDLIRGLAGDDRLVGQDGNDTLDGGTGADRLNGGRGNDVITGGTGADTMAGGSGADRFLYRGLGDARDVIVDLNQAEGDVLDLSAVFAAGPHDQASLLAGGYVRFVQMPGAVKVQVDANGHGDAWTTLLQLNGLTTGALGSHVLIA